MKKCIALAMLFASTLASAQLQNAPRSIWHKLADRMGLEQNLSIEFNNGHYVLYGSPEEKRETIQDLARWSNLRTRGRVNFSKPIIVDTIIPDTIRSNQYSLHLLNGPNCHNNSLMTLGLMERRMYVGDSEIKKHLEIFCQEIFAPELGAMGVQYSRGGQVTHSYIVVSEKLTFEKPNVAGDRFPSFKELSSSRKREDNFYRCSSRQIQNTCSAQIRLLAKDLEVLHAGVSNLIKSMRNASSRNQLKQAAQLLEERLFRDNSCPQYQELIKARIDSIISFFVEMEMTGGFQGRGTYDNTRVY